MVIAYHLIWTAYGTWLPNDPRGSGSTHVGRPSLAEFGPVHFGRRQVQPSRSMIRTFYEQASPNLAHAVVRFDSHQIPCIAAALGEVIDRRYTCYACAILADHVHLIIRKHKDPAEQMIADLQAVARLRLSASQLVASDHPVWTVGGWKVFLNTPNAIRSRVLYVANNPPKEGMPRQRWPFVQTYDGWPHLKPR